MKNPPYCGYLQATTIEIEGFVVAIQDQVIKTKNY